MSARWKVLTCGAVMYDIQLEPREDELIFTMPEDARPAEAITGCCTYGPTVTIEPNGEVWLRWSNHSITGSYIIAEQ